MKRIGLCVLIVAVLAGSVFAGAKRIDDYTGVLYDTIFNADSTGTLKSDKISILNVGNNQKYDKLLAWWYFEAPTAVSTNTALGDVDSVKITLKTGSPYWEHILYMDSALALSDTFDFKYDEDYWINGVEVLYPVDDTVAAYWKPQDTAFEALNMDHLWFEYHISDTSGTGDTIACVTHYFIRLIEEYE
jgi:hypothetical protein